MPAKTYSFSSPRLRFTEATWGDLTQIHILQSTPEVDEFNTLGIPKSIEATRKNMRAVIEDKNKEKRSFFCWIIRQETDSAFVGICGLTLSAERFRLGEIYYNLLPAYWGKGYGTESAKALIRFCFTRLKLHRVEAGVATANERSIRLLEKVGMTREALHRKILPIRGEWKDNYEYAILEDDRRDY
jgi:ribosomal-protein-alanine N-acetyltransferase